MRVERAGDRSTASIREDIGAGNVQVVEPVAIAMNLKEKTSERDGMICTVMYFILSPRLCETRPQFTSTVESRAACTGSRTSR